MSFTNHTPNYNLPQYVGTDKPTFLGDFNNAMSAIDTALHNNEQNAGEGLSELQQAQAALTETQETLTEVQTEVANVSGMATTVNQNVQQALSAANDATTAANSATSQIQPAVTAANQASADAQAAQQVANGNVTTLNDLSERVTALENSVVTEISLDSFNLQKGPNGPSDSFNTKIGFNAPDGTVISEITGTIPAQSHHSCTGMSITFTGDSDKNVNISESNVQNGYSINITGVNAQTVAFETISSNGPSTSNGRFVTVTDLTIKFKKVSE